MKKNTIIWLALAKHSLEIFKYIVTYIFEVSQRSALPFVHELGDLEVDESVTHYNATEGKPCTHAGDFDQKVGTAYVTNAVEIDLQYVLTPGDSQSIEIYANHFEDYNLTSHSDLAGHAEAIDTGLSGNRIMIIDCKGTCGISQPSTSVSIGDKNATTKLWQNKYATNFYYDAARPDKKSTIYN